MDLLASCKMDLRISHNKIDSLIIEEINSCQQDIERMDIIFNTDDELIKNLVRLYIRSLHNFQGQGSLYWERYKEMRDSISFNIQRKKT